MQKVEIRNWSVVEYITGIQAGAIREGIRPTMDRFGVEGELSPRAALIVNVGRAIEHL